MGRSLDLSVQSGGDSESRTQRTIEQGLTDRVCGGDEHALADLFAVHRPRLRKMVAFRMDNQLRGRVDPSDVLQEAFISLASRIDEFQEKNKTMSFFVWARLITTERLLKTHRRHITTQKRDARRELSIDRQLGSDATSMSIAAALLQPGTSVGGREIRNEQREALMKLLDEMDATDREVVALRVFEGLTNGEVAEVLGLTKQTASRKFIGAVQQLRTAMECVPGLSEQFLNE
ncbi:MAG: sigma-70 family RNA polymerase sigma factor [Planctomycetales bacterium]|nr:sigma-70 family RNA polymerase sigma factor [Planctomycetales bacterium]